MVWVQALIFFVVGLVAGIILTRLWGKHDSKRNKSLEKQLTQIQNSHHNYQEQVTRHFARTAELVNNLTHQYQVVYTHLANGSKNLCQDGATLPAMKVDTLSPSSAQSPSNTTLGDPMANLLHQNLAQSSSSTIGSPQAPKDYPQDPTKTIN